MTIHLRARLVSGATPRTWAALFSIADGVTAEKDAIEKLSSLARRLERENDLLMEALTTIRDMTLTDAEGPELRAQNECNHRRACTVLSVIKEAQGLN